MFFPIVSEQLIHRFKFWANGEICEGMRQDKELHRLVASFPNERRQQAYSLGIDLHQHGKQVVMTCSQAEYSVWVVLRSQSSEAATPTSFQGSQQAVSRISDSSHPEIGHTYRVGLTYPAQASADQGQTCKIVEV